MSDFEGVITIQKVFRRPGDNDGQLRVRFGAGENSVTVKFQATQVPRLFTFLVANAGEIEVEPRTQTDSE
jgi:hypothetical protein